MPRETLEEKKKNKQQQADEQMKELSFQISLKNFTDRKEARETL